jgi:branched-chain amino acid transport system ATP-binding protein
MSEPPSAATPGDARPWPDRPSAKEHEPDGMTPSVAPVLELRSVDARYGAFRALFDVSLAVAPGSAVALVGPNGAGKTTIARVASGLVAPTSGSVVVAGHDMTGHAAFRFARAGVAHAPEGRSVFAMLTVEENLALSIRRVRGRRGVRAGLDDAYELFPILRNRRKQAAGTLSGGEQRILAMARVLVDTPKVLVADELSLGLAPIVVEQTYKSLVRLREAGTSLLVIEQHVPQALALCDQVVVLDHGSVSWSGRTTDAGDRIHATLHASAPD